MQMYIIDLFDPEARDFINKMAYIYKNIEDNQKFYKFLTRSQKFLSLIILTHLIFETPEKESLEADEYSLGFFADYFNLDVANLKNLTENYSEENDYYGSLDIVGKDVIFNRFLIRSVNELKNYRDIYRDKGISIKEMFIGYQGTNALEYGVLNRLIHNKYLTDICQKDFLKSNLCDFYEVELNDTVGLFVPKEKSKVKTKTIQEQ